MPNNNEFVLVTGTANLKLAKEIGKILGKEVHETVSTFADGEKRVMIPENLSRREVFIIQPTCPPVDSNLMELLLMIDAVKRSSATEITAVIPYFGYSRQDRKERSRVPISAALVAGLIEHAGANRILTLDIHSEQTQGFTDIPWDNLYSSYSLLPVLKEHFASGNLVVASPDKGGVLKATFYVELLNAEGLAIVYKERDISKKNETHALGIIGEVAGKDVLLVDDMIDTAGTIYEAARLIKSKGAKGITVAATHGIFSEPAPKRLAESYFDKIFIADSVPIKEEMLQNPRLTVISVAQLLAEAITCIYNGESISEKLIPKTRKGEGS